MPKWAILQNFSVQSTNRFTQLVTNAGAREFKHILFPWLSLNIDTHIVSKANLGVDEPVQQRKMTGKNKKVLPV